MTWPLKRPIGPRDIVKFHSLTGVVINEFHVGHMAGMIEVKITHTDSTLYMYPHECKRIGALTAKQNIKEPKCLTT